MPLPRPHPGRRARRPPVHALGLLPLALALAGPWHSAQAAAYVPGQQAPDAPTGDLPPPLPPEAAEPLRNTGIDWRLGPVRQSGSVALDYRQLRLDTGTRGRQTLLSTDIDWSTYLWQPWFVQLRGGLSLVAQRDLSSQATNSASGAGNTVSGRIGLSVFPASRFPLELRADSTDSRSQGDTLGTDYRNQRFSLSQGWRSLQGNDSLQFNLDRSRLLPRDGSSDTLSTLQLSGSRRLRDHDLDLAAQYSQNERSDTHQDSRVQTLSARHSWRLGPKLRVETLATRNAQQLRLDTDNAYDIDLRQIATLASWQPSQVPNWATQVSGSARWAQSDARQTRSANLARAANLSLGISQELGPAWRVSATTSVGHLETGNAAALDNFNATASATWTPPALRLGGWQYAPTSSATTGVTQATNAGQHSLVGVQASHGISRSLQLGTGQSLALGLTQAVATLKDSGQTQPSQALSHTASLFWQDYSGGARQSFAGLSVSDARSWQQGRSTFQLVNLQLSQRHQLSRYASWSANLTLQGSHNEATEIDPFTLQLHTPARGWQQYHSGTLSYEQQKAFGVPRLRLSVLGSVSSAQLERRALGDLDAPRERISQSLEARLNYSIGRLDTQLSARQARIEGRPVSSLFARAQRRF